MKGEKERSEEKKGKQMKYLKEKESGCESSG